MENLGIDWKLLIAQLVNFGLFFFIFKKYMAKPFQSFLKNEEKKEAEKEKALSQAKAKDEELGKKEEELEKKMKKQTALVLSQAKEEAKKLKEELVKQVKEEIEAMRVNAKKQIEAEVEKNKKEMEQKLVELSSKAVNGLLKNYLSEQVSREITGNMLRNLAGEIRKYEN